MVSLDDLTGIPEEKRKEMVKCLDELMTFRARKTRRLTPLITGYNWFGETPVYNKIVTFSHLHETEAYKRAMLEDVAALGDTVPYQIRNKGATHLWDPEYRIRDNEGNLFQVSIRDVRNNQHINLENYEKPLAEYAEFKDAYGYLIATEQGWQVDIPFNNESELLSIVDLFSRKSGEHIFNDEGIRQEETAEQREKRKPWPDAYEFPVLIIGKSALQYQQKLSNFGMVTRCIFLVNDNEINFLVHKNLKQLKKLRVYQQLRNAGFREERCLANKLFIREIDKDRGD